MRRIILMLPVAAACGGGPSVPSGAYGGDCGRPCTTGTTCLDHWLFTANPEKFCSRECTQDSDCTVGATDGRCSTDTDAAGRRVCYPETTAYKPDYLGGC